LQDPISKFWELLIDQSTHQGVLDLEVVRVH
jgi:hypothetical protein